MRKIAAVLLLVSGCSVALQSKPKAGVASSTDCSTTSAYWIADTVGVAASAAALGVALYDGEHDKYAFLGAGAITGILYLASAKNGYDDAQQCRANREQVPAPAVAATDFSKR